MSTPTQIRDAIDGLRQYFADRDGRPVALNAVQWTAYLEALAPLAPEALEHAVRHWIRVGRFFPRVADLLPVVDTSACAHLAWATVERAIRCGGVYRGATFINGEIGEAVRLTFGSWARAGSFDFDSPGWAIRRSTFLAIYPTLRPSPPVTLGGLPGAHGAPYVVAPVAGLPRSSEPPRGELTDSEARALLAEVKTRARHAGLLAPCDDDPEVHR